MLIARAEQALATECKDPNIVFKKCCNPDSLVVMRHLSTTETTESRPNVVDSCYAQFRASELLVVKILRLPDLVEVDCARSLYENYLEYRVGEIVRPLEYDPDLELVSGKGIHFFRSVTAALCFGHIFREEYPYFDGTWYNYNYNGKLVSVHNLVKGKMVGKQVEMGEDGKTPIREYVY
jgi:hypothetical protein